MCLTVLFSLSASYKPVHPMSFYTHMHRNAGIRNRCFLQLSHLPHKSPQMAGNTVTICWVQDLKLRKQNLRKPEG